MPCTSFAPFFALRTLHLRTLRACYLLLPFTLIYCSGLSYSFSNIWFFFLYSCSSIAVFVLFPLSFHSLAASLHRAAAYVLPSRYHLHALSHLHFHATHSLPLHAFAAFSNLGFKFQPSYIRRVSFLAHIRSYFTFWTHIRFTPHTLSNTYLVHIGFPYYTHFGFVPVQFTTATPLSHHTLHMWVLS